MKQLLVIMLILILLFCQSCSNKNIVVNSNPFFPHYDGEVLKYEGSFLFDDLYTDNGTLTITKLITLFEGVVYKVQINCSYLDLGERGLIYFYVTEHEIWKLNILEESVLSNDNFDLKSNGDLMFSDDVSAKLSHNVTFSDDRTECEYSYNNDRTETGYFEQIILKRGIGIVKYSSGYGALRNYLDIQVIENK